MELGLPFMSMNTVCISFQFRFDRLLIMTGSSSSDEEEERREERREIEEAYEDGREDQAYDDGDW